MNDANLKEYAEINVLIARLSERKDVLKKEISLRMENEGIRELKFEGNLFWFRSSKVWDYPQEVKDAEQAYKKLKKISEEAGTATVAEIKNVLNYKAEGESKLD